MVKKIIKNKEDISKNKEDISKNIKKELVVNNVDELKKIYEESFDSSKINSSQMIDNSVKELELGKLVLQMIKNPDYLNSTTNLTEDEVGDLVDGYYLNLIFDSDLIDEFLSRHQTLKRSQTKNPKNLLEILISLTGKNLELDEQTGIRKIIGNLGR